MAECSDKGVPAALFMALTRSLIRAEARRSSSPQRVLQSVHRLLLEVSRTDMFVTVFYGVLEPASGLLRFVSAGHDRPLLYSPSTGECRVLVARGMLLGYLEKVVTELREGENPGFEEFLRQEIDGWPEGRLWAGAWGTGKERSWATYLAAVSPMEYWTPGLPRGYLTMLGLQASSQEWGQALAIYRELLGTFRAQRVSDNEPVGEDGSMADLGELAVQPFEVRWCPCAGEYVALSSGSPARTWPNCPCETQP